MFVTMPCGIRGMTELRRFSKMVRRCLWRQVIWHTQWPLMAASHYLNLCSFTISHILWHLPQGNLTGFNTLRPGENGHQFSGDNWMKIYELRLKFHWSLFPINNITSLNQIMAWRRLGDKPLSDQWWLVYWCIYASLSLNDLTLLVHTRLLWEI